MEGGPQTLRQQALAEDIAARTQQQKLAEAEIYGGGEGARQTLQQQLVQSQLAGQPMDRAMMLTSQALAAREAGMDTLADSLIDMAKNITTSSNGNNDDDDDIDPLDTFWNALGTDELLKSGTKFTIVDGEAINNAAIPPEIARELGAGAYGIDKNGNIVNMEGKGSYSREELRELVRKRREGEE